MGWGELVTEKTATAEILAWNAWREADAKAKQAWSVYVATLVDDEEGEE
jgi:hypothetical protein